LEVTVYGAGAIGSLVGARLFEQGEKVRLIARPAHTEAIQANGLRIKNRDGTRVVRLPAVSSLEGTADVILLAVKSQDVRQASMDILRQGSAATVVTMQNGVRSDQEAADVLGRDRVVGCVLYLSTTYLEPGLVVQESWEGFMQVGAPFPEAAEKIAQVQGLLGKAIPTVVAADISAARWTKLITNLPNVIMTITGLPVGRALRHPSLARLAVRTMREGVRTARASGKRLDDSKRARRFQMMATLPAPLVYALLARRLAGQFPPDSTFGGSTQQSLLRGSSSELDYLNGEIVKAGQEARRPTPVNSALMEVGREVFNTRRTVSPDQLLAIRALRS
jgi:2-dehydropantoate 2-reductase